MLEIPINLIIYNFRPDAPGRRGTHIGNRWYVSPLWALYIKSTPSPLSGFWIKYIPGRFDDILLKRGFNVKIFGPGLRTNPFHS